MARAKRVLITAQQMEALMSREFTAQEIADMYNCHVQYIWQLQREYGLHRRAPYNFRTCAVCGKQFYIGEVEHWGYRRNGKVVCSWKCVNAKEV